MHRHELSDAEWKRIEALLPPEKGRRGRPSELPNRVFMNAIFYVAKTGAPWRDLPERFGPWKTVHNRFTRWNRRGIFQTVLDEFKQGADHESNMVDGSYIKAHQDAAGGKGGPKFRVLDALAGVLPPRSTLLWTGLVTRSMSTSPQETFTMSPKPQKVVEQAKGKNFIADKGYDADKVIEAIEQKEMMAVIPSKANRKTQREIDRHVYRERHLVENFFCKIKRYRRVATRYEKTAINFLGFVLFASIRVWLS
jgi:transposase